MIAGRRATFLHENAYDGSTFLPLWVVRNHVGLQLKAMGTKGAQKGAAHAGLPGDDDGRLAAYITQLKAEYGSYGLPAKDARRIVDESLGDCSLTDLLHISREDGVK